MVSVSAKKVKKKFHACVPLKANTVFVSLNRYGSELVTPEQVIR
jgi:hypothetical protein